MNEIEQKIRNHKGMCEPDRVGICIYCLKPVVTPVDDNGDPEPMSEDDYDAAFFYMPSAHPSNHQVQRVYCHEFRRH